MITFPKMDNNFSFLLPPARVCDACKCQRVSKRAKKYVISCLQSLMILISESRSA